MIVRALLAIVGLFHVAVGAFMLVAPDHWYAAVPGVAATGPFNPHFVRDIGLAFVASGAGLMAGAPRGRVAAAYACAGATWPALHALFLASANLDELREAVERRWSLKGLIALSYMAMASRNFPVLKRALGHARACQRVRVGGAEIPVEQTLKAA